MGGPASTPPTPVLSMSPQLCVESEKRAAAAMAPPKIVAMLSRRMRVVIAQTPRECGAFLLLGAPRSRENTSDDDFPRAATVCRDRKKRYMAIAFFDFDGTLIQKDSGVLCAVPCIRRGLLGPRIGARLVTTYLMSKAGLRTRADAQRVGFACYAGRTLEELRAIMRALHDEHLAPWVSRPMRERVAHHRAAGDRVVVLTASAFFFAEPLAAELGVDELVGTQVAFARGVCTGRVDGPILDGAEKLAVARGARAAAHATDLAACSFYSDHTADLPLLDAVGKPVAVGPTRALATIARARGWPVVHHEGRR